jgi:IQ calmodulin-binding motif.
LKRNKMAIVIQKYARRYLARKELKRLKEKQAARVISDIAKMYLYRRHLQRKKENKAALKIQTRYRVVLAKKVLGNLKFGHMVKKIQSLWRMVLAKKERLKLRKRLTMTIRIQKFWKKKFKEIIRKVVKIQAFWRMMRGKFALFKLRKRLQSCIKIQSGIRMWRAKIEKKELILERQTKLLHQRQLFKQKIHFINRLKLNAKYAEFFDKLNKVFYSVCFKAIKVRGIIRNHNARIIQGMLKIKRAKRKLRRLRRIKAAITLQVNLTN